MNRQASGARFRQSVRMPTRSAIEQSDDPVYLIVDELIRLVNGRPTEEQVGFVRALSPGMRMMWGVFMVDGEVLRYIEGQVASPPEGWSLIDDDGAISIMCETWRVSPSELVGAAVDRAKRGQRDFERRVERGEDPWLRMWNDGQELRTPQPDAGCPLLVQAAGSASRAISRGVRTTVADSPAATRPP